MKVSDNYYLLLKALYHNSLLSTYKFSHFILDLNVEYPFSDNPICGLTIVSKRDPLPSYQVKSKVEVKKTSKV